MTPGPRVSGSILVTREDTVLYEAHGGYVELGGDEECSASTRHQIASVSKQFTAAAVLLLEEAGELSVDEPVARWFAGAPRVWHDITIHQLLSHSSGLGHWDEYPSIDLHRAMHDHEMVETVAALPPLFPPGSGFHYSSPGYVLLADIVERISGQSYPTYLEDQVFSPLGLSATFAGNAGDRPDVATGHVGGRPAPSFELDHTGKGAGDVWSTAVDLDRWVRAVADGRLLGSASTAAMLAPQVPTPAGRHYGYGWFVGSLGRHRACFHTGDNHGFVSLNAWLPDAQLRVTLLSNDDRTTFTVSSDDPPRTSGSDVRTTPGAVDLLRSLQVSDSRG